MIIMKPVLDIGLCSALSSSLCRVEESEVRVNPININARPEFSLALTPSDSSEPRSTVFIEPPVSLVDLTGCLSEVLPSVVSRETVNVINKHKWESADHVQECKSMRGITSTVSAQIYVSALVGTSSDVTDLHCVSRLGDANENASLWIVTKQLFQSFLGNHVGTFVEVVEELRQPLTRWCSGCIPSRATIIALRSYSYV